MQYEIPLYVVPTSKARASFRDEPRYGSLEGMVWAYGAGLAGKVEELRRREYSSNPGPSHHSTSETWTWLPCINGQDGAPTQ